MEDVETQVTPSTEETTEVAEETTELPTEEVETPEEVRGEAGDEDGEAEKHRKAFEDQKRRAEKAEAELKKLKQQQEKSRTPKKGDEALSDLEQQVATATDRAERAELRSMGITHADDITFVRNAARRLGVDPSEAASDSIVVAKLEQMREGRATKEATPAPGKGSVKTPRKIKNAWDMTEEEFQKETSRIMSGRA